MQKFQNLLQQKSEEEIQKEYLLLQGELETFMLKSEQLERLVFIQNLLTQRQQDSVSQSPVSENLL